MIELERSFFDEMVEHGLGAFPNEACGLLAGKEGMPVKFFAMTNSRREPGDLPVRPQGAAAVFETEMDDEGWESLGDLPLAHALGGLSVRDRPDQAF